MTETPTKAPVTQAELRKAQADTWVYFDGGLRRYGDAHLGLLTHALHYGTGCFEGIRAYWSERQRRINVFRMADHFARMTGNARMLHMELPHTVDELCDITVELMRRNDFRTDALESDRHLHQHRARQDRGIPQRLRRGDPDDPGRARVRGQRGESLHRP